MERLKLLEAHRTTRRACALLRADPRNRTGRGIAGSGREALAPTLVELLPMLSILHSFAPDKEAAAVYVYEILSQTITQVIALCAGGVATCDDKPHSAGPAPETTAASPTDPPPPTAAPPTAPVLTHPPVRRWADVQGCEEAVAALRMATVLPARFPWLFTGGGGGRRRWQRVLLYGPPGTGKTMLAHATVGELPRCALVSLSSADVLSKWVGESERQVRTVFAQAAQHERCVVFLDELDALCSARGSHGESEVARRLTTELLVHLQNLAPSLVVVAATNLPWEMDSAVLRRFDAMVYVGLPSLRARRELVARQLAGVDHTLRPADVDAVAARTEGFSASDVVRLVSDAVMAPLANLLDATRLRLATVAETAAHLGHSSMSRPDSQGGRLELGGGGCEGGLDGRRSVSAPPRHARVLTKCGALPSQPRDVGVAAPDVGRRLSRKRSRSQGVVGRSAAGGEGAVGGGRRCGSAPRPPPPEPRAEEPHACFYVPCHPTDPRAMLAAVDVSSVPREAILVPKVTLADVEAALARFIPSVTQQEVNRYSEWRRSQRAE